MDNRKQTTNSNYTGLLIICGFIYFFLVFYINILIRDWVNNGVRPNGFLVFQIIVIYFIFGKTYFHLNEHAPEIKKKIAKIITFIFPFLAAFMGNFFLNSNIKFREGQSMRSLLGNGYAVAVMVYLCILILDKFYKLILDFLRRKINQWLY